MLPPNTPRYVPDALIWTGTEVLGFTGFVSVGPGVGDYPAFALTPA